MSKKMLIDASRGDETRVVVMVDGRIEEIDHETADRRPIKSNIYLARVTRVEPSLQAAFVDYGGNRHGFLPFSEIHPDYYQLPVADREALLAEVEDKVEERRQRHAQRRSMPRRRGSSAAASSAATDSGTAVDPEGDQPHVEFPVDENGDFIQPEALTADGVEAADAGAEPEDDSTTVELTTEDSADVADTDAVAATLGLDQALTEEAVVEEGEDTATVSMTQAADADDSDAVDGEDEEPAKTVTAATGTEKDEVLSEDAADDEEDAEAEDDVSDSDEDVTQDQIDAEGAESDDDGEDESSSASTDAEGGVEEVSAGDNDVIEEAGSGEGSDGDDDDDEDEDDDEDSEEGAAKKPRRRRRRSRRGGRKNDKDPSEETISAGEDDADDDDSDDEDEEEDDDIFDEDAERRAVMHSIISRRYKIQEVIKRRQVMLVQVTKEERGNKGAALSSYLSLAGRYCVYMPNTARGGGISRKITNAADRKKLKEIAAEIDVPDGAGLIIRTAGSQRTKAEIKRDYEYLQRLWEQIRELTLKSIAPAKIYEEGDLIKRTIRDLYSKEIDEVIVAGEAGYRSAKDFMKMIMPSHAKNVKPYGEQMPLFARYQVEGYLSGMFNPTVQLPSGGYIVIGVTEALVAIDVNSGRATKEGSIEQTALKTNLEAADEVARQLRLRDLAGLIVIDFIDMDERKNNTAVEKRLKDKLKTDRARIQVGRISGFGLLEMSRQRLRPGMLDATTQP